MSRHASLCFIAAMLSLAACSIYGSNSAADMPPIDSPPPPLSARVTLTSLVEDVASPGVSTDPNLINPWGVAFSSVGALWVADNGTGLATVYDGTGATLPLTVTIPAPAGDTDPATPSGQVFNATATDFLGDMFILSTEDGTIAGWQTGATAVLRADNSASGAVYKGLDILDTGAGRVIVAANFSKGSVDVFDASYHAIALSGGSFVDPSPVAGFAPFNVLVDGGNIYVGYAKQDAEMHDDVSGPGNGAVDVFDKTGAFVRRLITGGVLDSPWALTIAPADYPAIGGDLLVGNFGDGRISAIDPTTGAVVTQLEDALGAPLTIPGLWALRFGDDQTAASHLQLFFSAGPGGESHGVLGKLDVATGGVGSGSGSAAHNTGGGNGGGYGY
jgi:uncharacterized protein (TIGR03118 family)